uniref:TGF_BETA_2 domain-containing protein n=1 Tax=Heterorhabditis bacteriophora TaxID=37862 RepID=A0A1I7W8S6_HETBA
MLCRILELKKGIPLFAPKWDNNQLMSVLPITTPQLTLIRSGTDILAKINTYELTVVVQSKSTIKSSVQYIFHHYPDVTNAWKDQNKSHVPIKNPCHHRIALSFALRCGSKEVSELHFYYNEAIVIEKCHTSCGGKIFLRGGRHSDVPSSK